MQLSFGLPHGGHSVVIPTLELAGDGGGAIPRPLSVAGSG